MAFSTLTNLVRMTTPTVGTGTVTLGSAVTGFVAVPVSLDGKSVTYEIADPGTAPTAREIGRGTYTNSGTTLSRDTVFASTAGGGKISLSGAAYVSLTLADDDLKQFNPANITMQAVGDITCAAGTTTTNPLSFISGVTLTNAQLGAMEYDGNALMFTPTATSRGAIPAVQFAALTGNFTLTSTTAAQKIFNVPTNGTLTVSASDRYFFELLVYVSGMSTTSGNAKIDLLGAGGASFTSALWTAYGVDATAPTTAAAAIGTLITSSVSAASIVTAAAGTGLYVSARGQFRVNTGGTIIPSITLVTPMAATIQSDSYFFCYPVSAAATTTLGNWS